MAKRNRIYSLRKGSVQWNEEDRLFIMRNADQSRICGTYRQRNDSRNRRQEDSTV